MQFQCLTTDLLTALQTAARALASRATNQILEGVLIEAQGDTLTLTCSDERLTIVTHTRATIDEPGRGVIPGKMFSEIARRLPDAKATVTMNDRFIFEIKSGALHMNLSGQNADLFPELPKLTKSMMLREVALPQDQLRDMIQKTSFAVSPDDSREVLTGCFLEIDHGEISMVALDGYRMARRSAKCSESIDRLSAIIPGRAVNEIARLLTGGDDAFAQLSFAGSKLHLRLGDTDIYVILIDGEYLQYRQLIPRQFATRIDVSLDTLRRALDRAALIARAGSSRLVTLRIHDNTLSMEAHSQTGDMSEDIDASQEGADLTISFNVNYLTDMASRIDSETITLSFNSPVSPCIATPATDINYLHLILPVRTAAGQQNRASR